MTITGNQHLCKMSNRINLDLLTLGYAKVGTDWKGEVLSPVYSRLYYVISGKVEISPGSSEKMVFESGMWYLIPTGCSFEYKCTEDFEHYFFHLRLRDFGETDLLRECKIPLRTKIDSDTSDILSRFIKSKNSIDALLLKEMAFSVLAKLLKENHAEIKTDNYSPCIMSAIRYIKENLSVKLTISEISENIFVSKSTLTKHFKKELNMSVNEYVYNLVMSGAEHMLTSSEVSIHDISEKYGFYDQFYFSKRFKETFRYSPQKYRRQKLSDLQ